MNDLTVSTLPPTRPLTAEQKADLRDVWKAISRMVTEDDLAPLEDATTIAAILAMCKAHLATQGDQRRVYEALDRIEVPPASLSSWSRTQDGTLTRRPVFGAWRSRVSSSAHGTFRWEVYGPNGRVAHDVLAGEQEARDAADSSARSFGVALA